MKPFSAGKRRRHTIRRRFRIGPTVGRVIGVAVLALLAVVSLAQATGRETAVYQSTSLREQQGSLEQEISELKLLEARAKTLERISQSEVKNDLVPIGDDVEYLDGSADVAGAQTSR